MLARGKRRNGALSLIAICQSDLYLSRTGGLCWWARFGAEAQVYIYGLQCRHSVHDNNKQVDVMASAFRMLM